MRPWGGWQAALLCLLVYFCSCSRSEIFSAGVPKLESGPAMVTSTLQNRSELHEAMEKLQQLEQEFSSTYAATGIQPTGYSDLNLRIAAKAAMETGHHGATPMGQALAPDAGSCINASLTPQPRQQHAVQSSKVVPSPSLAYRLDEQLRLLSDCSRASKVILPPLERGAA